MASNNAIICLTRGYEDIERYNTLIKRNAAIFETVNKKKQYPLIIFHEGNIKKEHKEKIRYYGMGQDIHFIDVSPVWTGGYEGMCRFQAYDVWNYCAKYDNVMRVDEDCFITKCGDPFDMKGMDYLRSVYFAESHSETNATLPDTIERLTGVEKDLFYNDKFVYTNVGVARVGFFLKPKINKLIKAISCSPEQRINRWGDLPVLGSLLNIYGKVGVIKGLEYYHESHGLTIKSNGVD